MNDKERNEARIRQYLLEDMSEGDNICAEDEESDHDEEDHISDSDHDTNTTVDDSDADPDFVPSESELLEESGEEIVDDVYMVQNETAVPTAGNDVVLNTTNETIETVVGGLGVSSGSTLDIDQLDEELVDDVNMVQIETAVPTAGNDVVLNTTNETIETVVGGLGVSSGSTLDIDQLDEELVDDVNMVQIETAVPIASDGIILDTIAETIEAVVQGLGGQKDPSVSKRNRNTFLSKDKLVRWKKTCEQRNIRTRSVNLVTALPGPTDNAKCAKTPLECFEIFVTDEIVDIITKNTNVFINAISGNFKRERACRLTDTTEMKAFLGLLILAGSFRSGHQNLEELFSQDGLGMEIFYGTMSLDRFNFLLRTIRFDNITNRAERRVHDKFAAFREVFEIFVLNCEKSFSLSCSTTVDEQLVPFRGKCSFRQYMKSKPAKYGIKVFTLTDAKMFYVKTMEVYLGAQPEGSPFIISNKPYDVVLRLAKSIEGKGRNITADNWFSSYALVYKLLTKKTSYVGTIRKDKGELPREFTQKEREPKSSIFGFQENVTIVSYAPKANRSVVLISSMHNDDKIDPASGNELKPEIVTYYNSTKSGVDVIDEKCGTYSTSRRCRRWPLVLFYRLLDIAGINAQVIFTCNNIDANRPRRLFLKDIGMEMVKPQAAKRSSLKNIPKQIRQSAKKIGQVGEEAANRPNVRPKKTRCTVCPRNRDIKTSSFCVKCNKPMCVSHMKTVCQECLEPQDDSE
jgi:hypothetical protein